MRKVLKFFFPAVIYIKCVLSGDECMSYDNQVGECMLPTICDTIPFLKDVNRTRQQTETLRKMGCGFEGLIQKICCPLPKKSEKCQVLNGIKGECKDIEGCTVIANLAVIEALAYYTPSCNRTSNTSFNICCPTSIPDQYGPSIQPIARNSRFLLSTPIPTSIPTSDPTPTTTPSTSSSKVIRTCQATSLPPDPSEGCCGQDASSSRILGGNETGIDQYPWLALLEYRNTRVDTIVTKCGGSLISGRYVVTAAHCVHESKTNPPASVRLGEHDTRTNIDCDSDTWYGVPPYCNNAYESIPIQRINVHALYNSRTSENDIALVRLNRTVNFNDFIKPICLPSPSATVPSNLYVAGWGATESGYASPVKMHVMVPYVDLRICHSMYPRLQLSFGRICAGGEIGKDSCNGDSGGPLMRSTKKGYELLGIVSIGQRFCHRGKPGIYTNVTDYLVWLRTYMYE